MPDATQPSVTRGSLPVSEEEEDPEDQAEGALRLKALTKATPCHR